MMLSPEAVNFEAPESSFSLKKTDLQVSEQCPAIATINSCYYNHLISVVLPDTLQVPADLVESLTEDCEYYRIRNLNLFELANRNFIESFVKEGSVYLLSINNWIDVHDCFCVTPTAKLILSLNKPRYQSLGLEGVQSRFAKNSKDRYVVTVDLSEVRAGSKAQLRLEAGLRKLGRADAVLGWRPRDGRVCPSSLAKYFADRGHEVALCRAQFRSRTRYSVRAPELDLPSLTEDGAREFLEWLGMLAAGAEMGPDEYLSAYETPEPSREFGQVKVLEWTGFFSERQLAEMLPRLITHLADKRLPWAALYVQGFTDCPLGFRESEQHFYTNADNSYCLLIDAQRRCAICTSGVTNKSY